MALAWALSPGAGAADAVIRPPTTLDGPSAAIGEFGGAAVASDGSGGVVYVKQVEGVPHVFAAQVVGGHWLAPVRVDWDSPFGAGSPRIAAADGGQLVVVWVTQIATVGNRIQRALMSSTLDPGTSLFGPPFVIDPNVGEGLGASPSLAISATGQGLVAYRVVTDDFKANETLTNIPQLRPGDVLADIRVATYGGETWSAPERVNRDPQLSMRPPTETNGPQVGVGRGDQAVIAWQEPEADGTARIWARRVFGTTLGLPLQASPSSLAGGTISQDADAFALSVSTFGEAKVVSRVEGAPGTALSAPSLFVNTLPTSVAPTAAQFTGVRPIASAGLTAGAAGVPSVAVDDQGDFRLAFVSGNAARVMRGSEDEPIAPEVPLGPAAGGGLTGAVTALNPVGGGVTGWPTGGAAGGGLAVREDFPGGGAQSALVSGAIGGPVSELAAGGSESGEAVLGFRQGEPGGYEIVGEPVSVPPPPFLVEAPRGWVRPAAAHVSWTDAEDSTGGVTYSLLIDGHVVLPGLHTRSATLPRHVLGDGVREVQVLATDAAGQQTLSGEAALEVDGSPPVAGVRRLGRLAVLVRVKDAQSGAIARVTRISFGDGAVASGRLTARHVYARAGRYTIVVRMRDRVGNEGTAHIRVSVR